MKAYYNGITLEGTPDEVAQCIKAIKADNQKEPHQRFGDALAKLAENADAYSRLMSRTRKLLPGTIFKMTDEQRRAYMDAWANDPD